MIMILETGQMSKSQRVKDPLAKFSQISMPIKVTGQMSKSQRVKDPFAKFSQLSMPTSKSQIPSLMYSLLTF
jgi:hypothetical protein